jgi:hypothetical protein
MSVVDLSTGKPIDKAPPAPNLLNALKMLVRRIEDGSLQVDSFYLITDQFSTDNGLTIQEAITMLEREKFRILCMSEGVKL